MQSGQWVRGNDGIRLAALAARELGCYFLSDLPRHECRFVLGGAWSPAFSGVPHGYRRTRPDRDGSAPSASCADPAPYAPAAGGQVKRLHRNLYKHQSQMVEMESSPYASLSDYIDLLL